MIKRISTTFIAALLISFAVSITASAATLSPTLQSQLSKAPDTASVGLVIVAFNTTNGLNDSHLNVLSAVGINSGFTLQRLGMVAAPATVGQVRALASNPAVRSIWSNDRLDYFDDQTSVLAGVDRLRRDAAFTRLNGGLPVSGQGNFSVVINDSGIDATHDDLKLGSHVVQNVHIVTDTETSYASNLQPSETRHFTPLLVVEDVPDTDLNVGHGTHVAGIVGGSGQLSGGRYAGVAPGAKLIGAGSGAVLFILNALGGYDWSMANQFRYNIRIISNSWGSSGGFNPDNPINIATKQAYDLNIISVFAAGNSGPGKDTHNPYAKAPWVISVAAGTKEGGLASFSSRGTPKAERLANSDPNDDSDAPSITASGTGREFSIDSAKFTSDVVSVRSKSNIFANGLDADTELPVAYVPFYTQISGTSMATPFVAGTVALMLDADPTLTPDEVKQILQQTASQMPGYDEYQVGAGYINTYAAVDKVFNRSKSYGAFTGATDTRSFNEQYSVSGPAPEKFHIDYSPAGLPANTTCPNFADTGNAKTFTVEEGMSVLDVFAKFDNALETGDGNTIGILVTDPACNKYSSGIALPVLDSPTREVVVKNPMAGKWIVEVRGVRGLAALPNVSLPTSGAAAPGPVNITVTQQLFTLAPVADIQGHAAQAQIESVLKNRMMDTFSDSTFRPDSNVTREDFARLLVLNTPLRQSLGSAPKFVDVTSDLAPIAEAVTAKGSNLRDWDFTPNGMMSASGSSFNPGGNISRLDMAIALVRALGLDAEAKAKAGSNVTVTYSGQTLVLADNADIPSAQRGYVQLALDRGILQAYFSLEQGPFDLQPTLKARVKANDPTTRAWMAYGLDNFRKRFVVGN